MRAGVQEGDGREGLHGRRPAGVSGRGTVGEGGDVPGPARGPTASGVRAACLGQEPQQGQQRQEAAEAPHTGASHPPSEIQGEVFSALLLILK